MPDKPPALTRRERQIMDVLYKLESATAAQVLSGMPDQTNYSTIRAQLRGLEEKGHVTHVEEGLRYVYRPALERTAARRSAFRHLVNTFFEGSTEQVLAALVGGEVARLRPAELDRLSQMIAAAQQNAAKKRREPL